MVFDHLLHLTSSGPILLCLGLIPAPLGLTILHLQVLSPQFLRLSCMDIQDLF